MLCLKLKMGVGILQLNSKSTMNAALCNIYPIFKFSETHSQPSRCPSSWIAGRSSNRLPTPRSLVIETVEDQVDGEARSESVARRLILLRHAKSSWTDRSLRGIWNWKPQFSIFPSLSSVHISRSAFKCRLALLGLFWSRSRSQVYNLP